MKEQSQKHQQQNHQFPKNINTLSHPAERLLIGASVIGTIATAATQQAIFAAIPLTAALGFNLSNRQRLEQRINSIRQDTVTQVQQLSNQVDSLRPTLGQANITQESLEDFTTQINHQLKSLVSVEALNSLQNELNSLIQRFEQRSEAEELGQLKEKLQHLASQIPSIKQNLQTLSDEQDKTLASFETQLKNQLNNLVTSETFNSLQNEVNFLTQDLTLLINASKFQYEILSNRESIHKVLQEALNSQPKQLIITCPWINQEVLTFNSTHTSIYNSFKNLLNNGTEIQMAYGYIHEVKDLEKEAQTITLNQLIEINKNGYSGLQLLLSLEREFPNLFKLYLVKTHAKYFICDNTFAMFGSHNFLRSKSSPDHEIGIRTSDKNLIKALQEDFKKLKDKAIPQSLSSSIADSEFTTFTVAPESGFYFPRCLELQSYGVNLNDQRLVLVANQYLERLSSAINAWLDWASYTKVNYPTSTLIKAIKEDWKI